MGQSYSAKGVKTSIAYGKPDFAVKQFRTFDADHLITILSNEKGRIEWQDEISFEVEGQPEKYTIYGVGFERKVGNKKTLELNGSGVLDLKFTSPTFSVESFFGVYSKMYGEVCKSGNIKFKVDENGQTNKILVNGQITDAFDTYASNYQFCAKLLPQ